VAGVSGGGTSALASKRQPNLPEAQFYRAAEERDQNPSQQLHHHATPRKQILPASKSYISHILDSCYLMATRKPPKLQSRPSRPTPPTETKPCPILQLPLELRLQIYRYLLLDQQDLVVGTVRKERNLFSSEDEKGHDTKWPYGLEGVPADQVPIIRYGLHKRLLTVEDAPMIPATAVLADGSTCRGTRESYIGNGPFGYYSEATPFYYADRVLSTSAAGQKPMILGKELLYNHVEPSLRRVCQQISTDLIFNTVATNQQELRLFMSFPYGCIIAWHLHQQYGILDHLKNLYISGVYHSVAMAALETTQSFSRPANRFRYHAQTPAVLAVATQALRSLISHVLGSPAHPTFRRLELRAFCPGDSNYRHLWDDSSPLAVVLKSISGGELDMGIGRFKTGSTVQFVAEPRPEKRHIRCWWAKEEVRDKLPKWEGGEWDIVAPEWNNRNENNDMNQGPEAKKDPIKWFKILNDGLGSQ
jgi:hypothetical protein